MAGYQVGSACYSTQAEAVGAIASSQVGIVRENGAAGLVAVDVSAFDGNSISYVLTPAAGGTPVAMTVGVSVPPCALLDWSDGIEAGWLVGGAYLLCAGVLFIARSLFGDADHRGSEGYGNT